MKPVKMTLKEVIQDQLRMAQIFKNAGKMDDVKSTVEGLIDIINQNKNDEYYIQNKDKIDTIVKGVSKLAGI